MRSTSRPLSLLAFFVVATFFGGWFAPTNFVTAQVRIPAEALAQEENIAEALRYGVELERGHRWGEALSHYEQALKDFPGRRELSERLVVARAHFDITRRYRDESFVGSLATMTYDDALSLYGDVLLKVQTHYVHEPNWQQLFDRGATYLNLAFTEPSFVNRHYREITDAQASQMRGQLAQLIGRPAVRSRIEAKQAADMTARMLANRLNLNARAVLLEFTCAAVGALDTYSSFLTGSQLDEVFSQIEGNFVGLGIELDVKSDPESLIVVNVISGGPADEAGLKAGDRIVAIDGTLTKSIENNTAADMLRGEEGSTVEIAAASENGEQRLMRMPRRRVEVPSVVDVKMIDADRGVAYFRITSFQKTTTRDVDAALWKLHRLGMQTLMIDVRGNPGGLLNSSVEIADKFISKGAIVATRGRSPREDFDYMAHSGGTWRVPLIVLIDGDSASASEIFAGAIHDHRRGTLVGVRSYGKGSVQGIFPLSGSKSGVRLTTAKFYSPNGQPISGRGVTPDVVVRTAAKPTPAGALTTEDPTLRAALQLAVEQISQRN